MTLAQRRAFNPHIQYLSKNVQTDPSIAFNPTECTVSAKIYKIQMKGVCHVFFYYGIFDVVAKKKTDDNPVQISPIDRGNRFVPLISVPQNRMRNEMYDAFGLYDGYTQGYSRHISKLLEYIHSCAKPNKQCSNGYALNDEYVDIPVFTEIHRATIRKFSRRYRPFTALSEIRTYPGTNRFTKKAKKK
jgi:hypothetical protein